SNFFNHPDLIAITIRTNVIHNIFENNKHLDIHKLDLFHIQYTNSLIELFQKLKKSKEQKYLLINDEIYINEDFIAKLNAEVNVVPFTDEVRSHSANMSQKMEELYKLFAEDSKKSFDWAVITQFINKRSGEFYRQLTAEEFQRLTENSEKSIYQNNYVTIEKKLLGKLNIQKFKAKLVCGLRYETEEIELYEFVNSNDKFIFINDEKSFYLVDNLILAGIDLSKNTSYKTETINKLMSKNELLKDQLSAVKTSMPKDVETVMDSYLEKISGVEFLDDLQNVDEQTNILKAMLNIKI
ncbi:MAG: hypothetical protein V4506_03195, partial [Bacteroidota bacterium]